jgi:hypothetical protein
MKIINIYFTLLVLVVCLVMPLKCFSFNSIEDNFSNIDNLNWNYLENGGSIIYSGQDVTLGSTGPNFPLMTRKSSGELFSNNNDSVLEIRFKYNKIGPSGSGIGIGFTGINGKPFYLFGIWADTSFGGVVLLKNDYSIPLYGNCSEFNDQPYHSNLHVENIVNDSLWHVLNIEKVEDGLSGIQYKIYLDKLNNSEPIFVVNYDNCNPKNIWFGNPLSVNNTWSDFSIDYLRLYEKNLTTPISNDKVIIIPGLGASWNTRAMVYNDTVPDESWSMTPFVNNYKYLISGLEKNGLVKDKDYFIWNYDWRRPVSEIVEKFDVFVDQKVNNDEKVSIIGHSLGGLTARIWAQNHGGDVRLNKVFSLGAPQLGVVEAYDVWNGAQIDSKDASGIALNILLALQKNKKPTKIETIRSFAPVIKDLLPVYDFVKVGNTKKGFSDLSIVNDYLLSENVGLSSLTNISTMIGVGESTKEWVNLGKKGIFDRMMGIWQDGRPLSYKLGDGDNTVLKKSAAVGNNITELASNHGDVVDKNVNNIIGELGLGVTESSGLMNNLDNKLIFFIGSPAKLNVGCDSYPLVENDSEGFVVVDGENVSTCRITIIGTGNGVYHLVTGKNGQPESWKYFENIISVGKTETFLVDGISGNLKGNNKDFICRQIRYKAEGLLGIYRKNKDLVWIIDATEKCNVERIEEKTFNFREDKKETMVTDQIIDNIRDILVGDRKNNDGRQVNTLWKKVLFEKKILSELSEIKYNWGWRPSKYMSLNYQKIAELIDDGNDAFDKGLYNIVLADLDLINHLISHFW